MESIVVSFADVNTWFIVNLSETGRQCHPLTPAGSNSGTNNIIVDRKYTVWFEKWTNVIVLHLWNEHIVFFYMKKMIAQKNYCNWIFIHPQQKICGAS